MSAAARWRAWPASSAAGAGRAVMVRALVAGALGGATVAAFDFFATWLWLEAPSARALLAVRLLGLLPPLGALLAAVVVALDRAARPLVAASARPSRYAPLPLMALLAPAVIALAITLFSGGRASRLPLREAWVVGAALSLFGVLYLSLRGVRRLARTRHRGVRARAAQAVALFVLAFLISKADRSLYPRHYEGLHAVLAVLGWALASLAAWTILPTWIERTRRRALAPLLACALAATVAGLPGDHDGRAALLSPRAATARSVMLVLAPAMFGLARARASADAVERARQARDERRAAITGGQLPRWEGAHVVVVTIDALRADHLGLYGYHRATSPELDALAARAVVLERAWTPTPRSSYALTSLMTGAAIHPRAEADQPLPDRTLADRLAARGYHTAAFYPDGIFFHEGARLSGYRDGQLGFARRDAENHDAESLTDAVLAELEDVRARGEPPTFLWAHYFDVHEPYEDRSFGDRPVERYDGEIRRVDRAFARLLAGLSVLRREVVLVVTADHGEEHGDHGGAFHGGTLYEEQLRVPLIVAAPGLAPRRVAMPVSLVDVAPTLLAMVGSGAIDDGDGLDVRPALLGWPFERGPVGASEAGLRAVLRWPYKLVEDARAGSIELFDLERDPTERVSVAGRRPDLLEALSIELAALP